MTTATFDLTTLMRFVNFVKDTTDELDSLESIEDVTIKEDGEILLHVTEYVMGASGDECEKERTVTFKCN